MNLNPFAKRQSVCPLPFVYWDIGMFKRKSSSFYTSFPRSSTPTFLFHGQAGHCKVGHCMYSQYCYTLAHSFGWFFQHIFIRCWCQQALQFFRPFFARPPFLTGLHVFLSRKLLRVFQEWTVVPRHGRSGFRQNDVLHVFDFKAPRDNSLLKCTLMRG